MVAVTINSPVKVDLRWTAFETTLTTKDKIYFIQYLDQGIYYTIWCLDGPTVFVCELVKAASSTDDMFVGAPDGYTKSQNDTDVGDFETNYKPTANKPLRSSIDADERPIWRGTQRRFGNLTAASTSEVLVFGRTYAEPASQAQRSIKSTSASDDDGTPSGARVIRITYLTSAYVRKTEDVATNGTAGVDTVGTDLRFIESMEVIRGSEAVGAVQLMTTTGGGGSEIMAISAGTAQTQACHHYIPAGKRCILLRWGATVDDECSLKFLSQDRPDGTNLVNRVVDLEKMFAGNPTPPTRLTFERSFQGGLDVAPEHIILPEKSYFRVTVVPNQATSTVIRAWMDYWEEDL